MPLLAEPVRFSDLFERKYLFNHRLDLAGLNQHTDFFQIAAARLHLRKQQPLAGHETLSKASTDPGQRRAKKFCFTGKLLRDRDCKSDEPSAELQDTKRCSPNPLANAIQYKIKLGANIVDLFFCIVDWLVCAQFAQQALVARASRGSDICAKGFGNLDGHYAHTACTSMDKHSLAGFKLALRKQC